jgi:hypothetical protein
MDLAGVHAEIKRAIARGGGYDTSIPSYAAAAVRWLENNYDWNYMYGLVDIPAADLQGESHVTLQRLKKEDESGFILFDTEGGETKLVQVSRSEVLSITPSATPAGYWKGAPSNGGSDKLIFFDATFPSDTDLRMEVWGWFFTDYPTDTASTIWLSVNAPTLIIARTMLSLYGILRDPSIPQLWQPIFDAELRSALLADDAAKEASRSYRMKYGKDLTGETTNG